MLNPSGYVMEISKESTLRALSAADRLTPIFNQMKWSVGIALNGYFITSDNPVAREVHPKTRHPIYGDHGFTNKAAEVTVPLSPKVLLLLSWNQSIPDLAAIARDDVRKLNEVRAALLAHLLTSREEFVSWV